MPDHSDETVSDDTTCDETPSEDSPTFERRDILQLAGGLTAGTLGLASLTATSRGATDLPHTESSPASHPESLDPSAPSAEYTQTATLYNPDPDRRDKFGQDVAMSADGTTALVGSPDDYLREPRDANVGEVYVYTRTDAGWDTDNPVVLPNPNPDPESGGNTDWFGESLALSADGNTALVGAPNYGRDIPDELRYDTGAVYVFTRTDDGWNTDNPAELAIPDPTKSRGFGSAVALSDDGATAVVHGYGRYPAIDYSPVYVYKRTDEGWNTADPVRLEKPNPRLDFTPNIAVDGDGTTVLVGSRRLGDSVENWFYEVFFFTSTEDGWVVDESVKRQSLDPHYPWQFGIGIELSADGTTALIGTSGYGSDSAYVYRRTDDGLRPTRLSLPDDWWYDTSPATGAALSADGTTAVVTNFWSNTGVGVYVGEAYVFTSTDEHWGFDERLKIENPDPEFGDQFGVTAALSADGTNLIIGAPGDRGRELLPPEDGYDRLFTGEAYVYERGETDDPRLVFEDQPATNDRVTVATVTMPDPGFVVIASTDGRTVYGVSEYLLAGRTDDLHIDLDTSLPESGTYLAAVQADTNDNQRFDAAHVLESCLLDADGDPLLDTADIDVRDH